MARSNAMTPNALALVLSKSLDRPVTPKAVRTVARSVLGAYDKTRHPAYQSHAYSADDVRRIKATFAARGTRTASAATASVKARKPRKSAETVTVES